MAVSEKPPVTGAEYQEPDPSNYIYTTKEVLSQLALESCGLRVCAIDKEDITLERLQDGVFRYPPVQVGVARDPAFIEGYITMGPTNWSEVK